MFRKSIQNGLTYGKNVNVNFKKGNNRVSISIEDDGPGIPEDQYKNVFKPFRLDKSRSLNKSGVGWSCNCRGYYQFSWRKYSIR